MSKPAAMILSLSMAGVVIAGAVTLATCGSSTSEGSAAPGSVALGGACKSYDDCQVPAGKVVECRCTDQNKKPVCVADLEAGEDCTTTGNFSPTCRPGTRCMAVDFSLSKAVCLPIAKAGESCGDDTGGCEDPTYCDVTQHCVVGQKDLGQSCSEHAECKAPYVCPWDKHVCSEPAAIGGSCDTNPSGRSECATGAGCDGAKCVAKKADGQDCLFDEECTSGVCGTNGCGRGPGPSDVIVSCGL
jgi:hypothetical protein